MTSAPTDLLKKLRAMPVAKREQVLSTLTAEEMIELERLSESLLEFIPRVTPALKPPRHLQPVVDVFDRCETEPVLATVSTPPQFGKTQLALHALVRMIGRAPSKRHAYISYAAERSEAMSRVARDIADNAGLKIDGSLKIWRNQQGGGVVWTGIGGPLTGFGVDGCLLVDDPTKNRAEAESSLLRERADQWFRDVALTRMHPGASAVVIATRWHVDDLPGRLVSRGWERINLPAVNKAGQSLWPEMRPLSWLDEKRRLVGAYTWASLYQGEPRPRGGTLFRDATLYNAVPDQRGYRLAIGVDLAYSKRTVADYSVAVTLLRVRDPNDPTSLPLFFVLDVRREQVRSTEFKKTLRGLNKDHPRAPMRWYASGVEQGVGDFIKQEDIEREKGLLVGIPLDVVPATADKFIRAQPVAAAWNDGRVLVPEDAPWVEDFLAEVTSFTGVNDAHDDQVDALAAAYDELADGADFTGDLDKFRGFQSRFGATPAAALDPEASWKRPSSHASDMDKVKPRRF